MPAVRSIKRELELSSHSLLPHSGRCQSGRLPQIGPIERATKRVSETKWHHGRNPSLRKLQRKALLGHRILNRSAPLQMVLVTRSIGDGVQTMRIGGLLLANKNGEVVVSQVDARVTFRLEGGAEEDQVLGDRSVQKLKVSSEAIPGSFGSHVTGRNLRPSNPLLRQHC